MTNLDVEESLAKEREAQAEYLLQFFSFSHLKTANLQALSRHFAESALSIVQTLPRNPERTTALRKLIEAKDCAVRAAIFK